MIITVSENKGIRCQVSDLVLTVDADKISGNLSLKTALNLPIAPLNESPDNLIAGAGEYEIDGIKVKGHEVVGESTEKELKTIYEVAFDEIKLCFLGGLKSGLDEATLDHLGEIDVLFLNVGAPYMTAKQASALIKTLEPKAIIPVTKNIKELASELGQKPEAIEKWVVKGKDIAELNSKIIYIKE